MSSNELAQVLIKKGANVNEQSTGRLSALQYALSSDAAGKTVLPIVETLMKSGANVGVLRKLSSLPR
jgi:hypothetical protein